MSVISALIGRGQRASLPYFCHVKLAAYNLEGSSEYNHACTLIWDFQVPELIKDKFQLFISTLIYDTLL